MSFSKIVRKVLVSDSCYREMLQEIKAGREYHLTGRDNSNEPVILVDDELWEKNTNRLIINKSMMEDMTNTAENVTHLSVLGKLTMESTFLGKFRYKHNKTWIFLFLKEGIDCICYVYNQNTKESTYDINLLNIFYLMKSGEIIFNPAL